MKSCSIKSELSSSSFPTTQPIFSQLTCAYRNNNINARFFHTNSFASPNLKIKYLEMKKSHKTPNPSHDFDYKLKRSSWVVGLGLGGAAALAVLLMADKAWAFGPEGPLVEEFWENVRRYGLYALTVSTGVLYSVFQPIYELLKNPISAVLVIIILGGLFFIVSQILSAMVGVSDFSYQYAY